MDKTTLVTGGTGLIGYNIITALLKRDRKVRALVRSIEKGKLLLPDKVELVQGDITHKDAIVEAMKGCEIVYHAAGFPEQWMKDDSIFEEVNVKGTQNMLEIARMGKVKKFIYTSTIDVFKGDKGKKFNESGIDDRPKGTAYERSKQKAFQLVLEAIQNGLPAINLHPAGLYGPGPTDSPGINNFIVDLKKGKVPMLLPGGLPLVFSEDCGEGHVLAEEQGAIGESYILSDDFYELQHLAKIILKALNSKKKVPAVMPLPLVKLVSKSGEWFAKISGKPPLIPKGQLHFLLWGAFPDSSKAQKELGWKVTPLNTGIEKTILSLFNNSKILTS
jgi:dihydroflavonol-4-reductase